MGGDGMSIGGRGALAVGGWEWSREPPCPTSCCPLVSSRLFSSLTFDVQSGRCTSGTTTAWPARPMSDTSLRECAISTLKSVWW